MDYVIGFSCTTKGNNSIWIIVDCLTKSSHFIPIRNTQTMDQMAAIYLREIVRLHGTPVLITSDRDSRFVSRFWQSLQRAMETKLNLSTTFHPQDWWTVGKDDTNVRGFATRMCNRIPGKLGGTPSFEVLYGRRCRSLSCWTKVRETEIIGLGIVLETTKKIKLIQDRIKVAQYLQKSYVNSNRRELDFQGNWVFLKVSPMKGIMRFGKKEILNPRYVRPFEIWEKIGPVEYRLALTLDFCKWAWCVPRFSAQKVHCEFNPCVGPATNWIREKFTIWGTISKNHGFIR